MPNFTWHINHSTDSHLTAGPMGQGYAALRDPKFLRVTT